MNRHKDPEKETLNTVLNTVKVEEETTCHRSWEGGMLRETRCTQQEETLIEEMWKQLREKPQLTQIIEN